MYANADGDTPATVYSGEENTPEEGIDFPIEEPGETIQQHGLGIPLIARVVLTHGGSIAIGSKKNEGFWITMRFTS